MDSWGNVYYLKSDTTNSNIWDCIVNLFPNHNLPKEAPIHFSIENDTEVLFWNCPKNENEFVEFCFTETNDAKVNTIRIVFEQNTQTLKNGLVHAMFYKELAENSPLKFFIVFFPLIRKFIPKTYISTKITEDKAIVQRLLFKQKSLTPQDLIQSVNKFIKNLLDPTFSGTIEFHADEKGDFFFPINWIEKLVDDLWFLNANFVKCYGIISAINKENLLRNNPQLRREDKESKKNSILKERFDKKLEHILYERRKIASVLFDTESKIIVKSGVLNEIEILPTENFSAGSIDSYEDLMNQIICSFDYRHLLDNKIQKTMSELFAKDANEDRVFQEKLAFHLKEMRLDIGNLENILKEYENLSVDNDFLKKKLETANNEIERLKQSSYEKSVKNENLGILVNSSSIENDIEMLISKNEELEAEKKSLMAEKYDLISRIRLLENKDNHATNEVFAINIPCSQKELFRNEITDFLYEILNREIQKEKNHLPQNTEAEVSRKRDVLETLLTEKRYDSKKSETYQKLDRIEKIFKFRNRPELEALEQEGFAKIENAQNHPKVYFYKRRYQVTFSLSPSDENAYLNKMKELKGRCFLL